MTGAARCGIEFVIKARAVETMQDASSSEAQRRARIQDRTARRAAASSALHFVGLRSSHLPDAPPLRPPRSARNLLATQPRAFFNGLPGAGATTARHRAPRFGAASGPERSDRDRKNETLQFPTPSQGYVRLGQEIPWVKGTAGVPPARSLLYSPRRTPSTQSTERDDRREKASKSCSASSAVNNPG